MSKAPSRTQDQFIVRLPDGMRDRIKVAADANNRSMNAEIVATLQEKYPAPADPEAEAMLEWIFENIPKEEIRSFLRQNLDKALIEKRITKQDIEDGLIPGVALRPSPEK